MIGIGMPISQSRSPLPILILRTLHISYWRIGGKRWNREKVPCFMRCNFPQPLHRPARYHLVNRVVTLSTPRRMLMRKLAIGIIAAGTLIAAAPAMAQVYLEGPGVGVRVGDRWDRGHHYGWDRGHHRGWRSYAYGNCRS